MGKKFTIRQVLAFTSESTQFKNRFFFMLRDVLKGIQIQKVKKHDLFDLSKPPEIYYKILSSSYPNYYPYSKIKGKRSRRQRKIKHQYDIILQIDESMSINTTEWKTYIGSQKDIMPVPQSQIKSVKTSTLKKWRKQAEKKFKTKKDQNDWIRKRREDQGKKGKYLNAGDFYARKLGIMMDWRFRFEYVFAKYGHCYYPSKAKVPPSKTNKQSIPAFTKHHLNLIQVLLKMGKLKT